MLVEEKPARSADALTMARERVTVGPAPAWATVDAVDFSFKGKPDEPLNHLYASCQVNAEEKQRFFRSVTRLETMEAVQRQSQWRLQMEPRTQSVTLHWIKIRRGDQEFEQANLQSLRLLEREEGLDAFIIDGWVTMLLVLGDVRPGDALDCCYTVTSRPRLLPEVCAAFFTLPPAVPVGKFRLTVRFRETRPMKWKSSAPELSPKQSAADGESVWDWSGENFTGPKIEANIPEWHMTNPWIQVSDCPDWGTVARAIARAWPHDDADPTVAELANQITAKSTDKVLQVQHALDLIQREFRYLSVNLDLGGHIPTPPGPVAQRRFGDCKDLSFLTSHLLQRLGIPARAVLVHTKLRQTLPGFLPTHGLFDHVVVEYQLEGQTRWVDMTIKHQGGGALNRAIPDYGMGLPVDEKATELIKPPEASVHTGHYELKESILLDTTGAASVIAVTVTTKGYYADMLRAQFETQGVEKFTKERLGFYSHRFASAERSGALEHRDDRAANEFVFAEVFEINGFLQPDPYPGTCRLAFPGSLIVQALPIPEKEERHGPYALPYPCNISHQIDVQFPALDYASAPRVRVESQFLKFSRTHKILQSFWSVTLNLSTMAGAVPPGLLSAHRKRVQEIWQESIWHMRIAIGHPHVTRRRDFGALPSRARKPGTAVTPRLPTAAPASTVSRVPAETATIAAPAAATRTPAAESTKAVEVATAGTGPAAPATKQVAPTPAPARREKAHSKRKRKGALPWIVVGVVVVLIVIAAIAIMRHMN